MPLNATILLVTLGSYIVGSLPFGYIVGRCRGVDLFREGSGNIGATNAGRVLGAGYGALVFLLDLFKGAVPVALAPIMVRDDPAELAPTLAAAAAFLGHLFPVFLGFRGGKGVATGAGTVLVLVPVPALCALATWILVALATRYVSLASIAAVVVLASAQLLAGGNPPATIYCLVGTLFVIVRHRGNVYRLARGEEYQFGDESMRQNATRLLYVMAAGIWFGSAGMFNFVVAPSLNATYKSVVAQAPSDRTAFQPLGLPNASEESRTQLASALFGAGVGPIFPVYFAIMGICALIAVACAAIWQRGNRTGRVERWRLAVAIMAAATVLAGWPISRVVADLRVARYDPVLEVSRAAKESFALWHGVSLSLSLLTVLLAGVLLALAAWLPPRSGRAVAEG